MIYETHSIRKIINKQKHQGRIYYKVWFKKQLKKDAQWILRTELLEGGAKPFINEYEKIQKELMGGSLRPEELKGLLNASYDNNIENVGDFEIDKTISSKTSKVYVNPETGQAVVAHQGTKGLADWKNNLIYAIGGKRAYKKTDRYKEAKKVQNQASKKYGNESISTIGHSQGGLQAELLGNKTNEIITMNKATRPLSNTKHKNQFDISTSKDIVSSLNPFQKTTSRDITINKKGFNPLVQHSYNAVTKIKNSIGR